jgi:hypothetical protein
MPVLRQESERSCKCVFEVCLKCLFCLFLRFFYWNFESLMLMLDFWKCSNKCDIFYWFISKFDVDYFEQNCKLKMSSIIYFSPIKLFARQTRVIDLIRKKIVLFVHTAGFKLDFIQIGFQTTTRGGLNSKPHIIHL